MKPTDEQRESVRVSTQRAKGALKSGDRIRAGRCGGIKRTYTFVEWDGMWAVTASGINDIAATNIDKVNGVDVNFNKPA